MKHPEHLSDDLKKLAGSLVEDSVASIDFDRIRSSLRQAAERVAAIETMESDLGLLRGHVEGRLAGMLKAVAAAARSRHRREEAAALAESLGEMSSDQLLTCFRRSTAQFRDCFPTTFVLPTDRSLHRRQLADIHDYK